MGTALGRNQCVLKTRVVLQAEGLGLQPLHAQSLPYRLVIYETLNLSLTPYMALSLSQCFPYINLIYFAPGIAI